MDFIDGIARIAASISKRIDDMSDDDKVISMQNKIDDIRAGFHEIKFAGQRVKRGWSDDALWDLGYYELKGFAERLHEFAYKTHGVPYGYGDDRSKWLKPRDDNWEDSIAPFNAIRAYEDANGPIESNHEFNGHKTFTMPTVRDCGEDYCAWIEDINYAADVIDEYIRMYDDSTVYVHIEDIYGSDEAKRQLDAVDTEFQRVWKWIGENILSLWD